MRRKAWILALVLTLVMLMGAASALADYDVDFGEVISQNVSLRVDHSTSASLIKSIGNGENFLILDRWENWLEAEYLDEESGETYTGWLRADFVVENPMYITLRNSNTPAYAYPSANSKMVGSLVKYTRLTVIEQLDRYWVVSLREAAASIPKTAAVWLDEELSNWRTTEPMPGTVIRRTTLRTGPGTSWTSVKTLNTGAAVQILGTEGSWYVILIEDDNIAYVRTGDISL
jgi:hypothetical protein